MRITKSWLEKKNACQTGLDWFVENHKSSIDGYLLVEKLIDTYIDWANWLITRMLNKKQCIEYAIFAAEKVLYLFENEYPENKKPRLAIEAAKKVLKNNTKKNTAAAANAAANAAAAAANAATAAAANAAAAATNAAAAAVYAAAAAAVYAANAAKFNLKKEIILNGLEIYKRGKNK